MITILMQIFPYDISEYIYILYKSMVIHNIMLSKLYNFELILDNLIRIYNNPKNTLISSNYKEFKLISSGLHYIEVYDYKIHSNIQLKINKLREQIKYLISINTNTVEDIYCKSNVIIKIL